MSVAPISPDALSNQDWFSVRRTTAQDFQNLLQSMQQSNIAGAQQAYANIQQLFSANGTNSNTSTAAQSTSTSAVATDWQTLGQALQSGSMSGAQSALSALQQDALSVAQTRSQAMLDASSVYAALQTSGNAPVAAASSTTGTNSVQNDISSLSQALQTGDTTSAQKILAQLESDLQQNSGQTPGQAPNQTQGHHHHHHGHSQQTQASNNPYATTAASASSIATLV